MDYSLSIAQPYLQLNTQEITVKIRRLGSELSCHPVILSSGHHVVRLVSSQ